MPSKTADESAETAKTVASETASIALAAWQLVAVAGVDDPFSACRLVGAIVMVLGSHFAGPEWEAAMRNAVMAEELKYKQWCDARTES